jgi:hypothetical protein
MPLIAFVLLAIVCLALLGFTCACLSDQVAQALDRASYFGSALPALVELWALLALTFIARSFLMPAGHRPPARASPATLQRFLF